MKSFSAIVDCGNAPGRRLPFDLDRMDGHRGERDAQAGQVGEVVVGPGPADDVRQRPDRRHRFLRQRPERSQQPLQLRRDRPGRVDQRSQVVERAAQVDERRVGEPHEPRQPPDRLSERVSLRGQRLGRLRQVADQPAQVGAALRHRGHEAARLDDEVGELAGVAVDLAEQGMLLEAIAGFRYAQACCGLPAAADVLGGRALDHVLEALERRRVERVEQLIEVDRAGRVGGADHAMVGDRRGAWRAPGAGRRSGWRSPTARSGGRSPRCPRGAG